MLIISQVKNRRVHNKERRAVLIVADRLPIYIYIEEEEKRLDNDRKGDSVRVRADRGDVADGRPRQYAVVHTSRGGDPTNWGNLTRNMMSFIW